MPKRSFDEKMDYYLRKMEKLKDKHRRKRRRSDSYSSADEQNKYYIQEGETSTMHQTEPDIEDAAPLPELDENTIANAPPKMGERHTQNDMPPVQATAPLETCPPLDPEILSALGEATDSGPTWGQDIHHNLTQLWLPLLKTGMDKEVREKVLKQYLIPSNCTLLQAPKLNIEISAAVIEMVRMRDKKVEAMQQQLGTGITAISRAMSTLLTSDNKLDAIKMLSDGCRILCDLHHHETQARIKMIAPGLAKPFLNLIQESERDETLFGVSLPEKIKASKTIEKQGLQIKKSVPPPRSNPVVPSTSAARQPLQGNWNGPPRYSMNRGGRGGPRRFPTSSRRPATTPVAQQPKTYQGKPRAPPRP